MYLSSHHTSHSLQPSVCENKVLPFSVLTNSPHTRLDSIDSCAGDARASALHSSKQSLLVWSRNDAQQGTRQVGEKKSRDKQPEVLPFSHRATIKASVCRVWLAANLAPIHTHTRLQLRPFISRHRISHTRTHASQHCCCCLSEYSLVILSFVSTLFASLLICSHHLISNDCFVSCY